MARFVWTDAKFEEVTKKLDSIESKMDYLTSVVEEMATQPKAEKVNTKTKELKAPKSGKGKSKKTNDYVVIATPTENRQKVYEAMGYKDGDDFDRKKYVATAKKLGVWSDKMNRVVGTYK